MQLANVEHLQHGNSMSSTQSFQVAEHHESSEHHTTDTQSHSETSSTDTHSAQNDHSSDSSHDSGHDSGHKMTNETHGDQGADSQHHEASDLGHDNASHDGSHGKDDAHGGVTTEHGAAGIAHSSDSSHGDGGHGEGGHGGGGHGGDHAAAGTSYHPPAPYVVDFGSFSIHANTLIMTYLVFAVLLGLAVTGTRGLKKKPGKKQVFFESVVDLAHAIVKTQISHNTFKYVPLIGTMLLFILVSNWMGLLPWRLIELFGTPHGFEMASPTNDLNTNGAIAFVSVASYWFFGIQKNGLGHFKHYFQPMWFLFPLNAMEDVARPLSLTFRLFGNILGGEIVMGILIFLTASWVVTSVVVLPMMLLEVLVGFIQAFIFSILTASYIGGMVADHH